MHWLLDSILGGAAYDVFRYLVGPLIVSLLGTAVLRYSFHKLKEKRELLTFFGGTFLVCAVLFFFLGSRVQAPDLEGSIPQLLIGPVKGSDRDVVAVVAVSILNTGTMQSIVKSWQVKADIDGNTYPGMFVQMPENFTFDNIPRTTLAQPTSITFHSEDNMAEKALKPIEVGAMTNGILFVEFSNVDPAMFRGVVTITVSYQDALSHQYSVSAKSTGQIQQVSALAGLHSELACPMPTELTGSIPKTPLATPMPVPAH
ncbi:MAG TPA: hypothetical protein VMF12_12260 [Xanthobacteraceae bacterium]|nr:hypothetical protein [Xanthobacteraceae bacterium]